MAGRYVALGDGDETRQPGLRREQIVAAGVEHALPRPVADRQQLAVRIEQEAVAHFQRRGARDSFERREACRQSDDGRGRLGDIAAMAFDRPPHRRDPEHDVRVGAVRRAIAGRGQIWRAQRWRARVCPAWRWRAPLRDQRGRHVGYRVGPRREFRQPVREA